MSHQYIDTHGRPTTADDPTRMMWYSSLCTYWTDDWSKLKQFGPGIPCCPHCRCPGMQSMMKHWDGGVKTQESTQPGYASFLSGCKETCHGKGVSIGRLWERVRASNNTELDKALNDAVKEMTKEQDTGK